MKKKSISVQYNSFDGFQIYFWENETFISKGKIKFDESIQENHKRISAENGKVKNLKTKIALVINTIRSITNE
jgi:hypothetical protein